jgi:hypothetical protein
VLVTATLYTATFTGAANTDTSAASVSVTAGSWQEVNGNPGSGGSTPPFTVDTVIVLPPPAGTSADMIMRDGTNGDDEIYDSNGVFVIYDISNNAITTFADIGQLGGLEWTAAGFGDFSSGPGETDVLMRDGYTGQFEIYDITNNGITSAAAMGKIGLEWTVAGFGDFSGNAGETDMLMRNSSTGAFEVYDISNNAVTSAASMGQVGLEWTVAGFGDFGGNANETDMLMRDSNTGALEVYDISDNAIMSATSMGQVGPEWQVGGIAADPPASAASAASTVLLVTAMASFGASAAINGAPATLPGGADTAPQTLMMMPQHT